MRPAQSVAREPVYVADVGPVASLEKKSLAKPLLKFLGICLVPLALGVSVGKISSSARLYNSTIEDAGRILSDVKNISNSLVTTQQALEKARSRAEGAGMRYLRNDEALLKELDDLPEIQPNMKLVYNSNLYRLPWETVGEVLEFYSGVARLQVLMKKHVEQTKMAQKALADGQNRWIAGMQVPLAALLEMPKGEDPLPTVRLVQLGPPVCPGQSSPNPKGCDAGVTPTEHEYRVSFEGPWGRKTVASVQGEAITGNTIVPLSPDTKVFQGLVRGGEASVSEAAFDARMVELEEHLTRLLELRTRVVERLNATSRESKRFSFFL